MRCARGISERMVFYPSRAVVAAGMSFKTSLKGASKGTWHLMRIFETDTVSRSR